MIPAPVITRKQNVTLGKPSVTPFKTTEITEMLIYEELARARIRDLEEDMRAQHARGHARAARGWSRVAKWAARQAQRHQR